MIALQGKQSLYKETLGTLSNSSNLHVHRRFQQLIGIDGNDDDGQLNNETFVKMKAPRCGVPDVIKSQQMSSLSQDNRHSYSEAALGLNKG